MSFVLGLDLGVASIGWCLMEKTAPGVDGEYTRIVDLGSYVFNEIEDGKSGKLENEKRREKRSIRRQRRRKQLRLDDLRFLIKNTFSIDFFSIDFKRYKSPYLLKIDGMKRQLSNEEISIVLYHYMKYRGFKSSRLSEEKANKENGELLKRINETRENLNNVTISEYLLNNSANHSNRIHNSKTEFLMSVSRDMYIDEIEKIFKMQTQLPQSFKDAFFDIYNRQRSYSIGPGPGSKYGTLNGQSMIERMVGKCQFDGEIRAPKDSFSSCSFRILSFLNNLQFKESIQSSYRNFTIDEVNKICSLLLKQKEVTYYEMFEEIKISNPYKIKGLEISRKQYISYLTKYKKDNGIESTNLSSDELKSFSPYIQKEILNKKIPVGFDFVITLKKEIEKVANKEVVNSICTSDFFDDVSRILLFNKTDKEIEEECRKLQIPTNIINVIKNNAQITETINLSISICKKLIPLMKNGMSYDKAMLELGYNHSKAIDVVKTDYLPSIDEMATNLNIDLKNKVVRHTLVNTRNIINAVIKKYGKIDEFSIELIRDLKNSFDDRKKIRFEQEENQAKNLEIKDEILRKYRTIFKSKSSIKKEDLIKYKLFIEQKGKDPYSGNMIKESMMFNNNSYQVDHIIPYSISFDDGMDNKVLVETKMNQEKKNRTPLEAFKNSVYEKNIHSFIVSTNISLKKKENLLCENYSSDDFADRNLVDSSYIAKTAKLLIETYLQPINVQSTKGFFTDKLKQMWGLKGFTHSFANKDYKKNNIYYFESYSLESNSIKVTVKDYSNDKIEIKYELIKPKKDKILSKKEEKNNELIKFAFNNKALFVSRVDLFIKKPIEAFYNDIYDRFADINNLELNEHLLTFVSEMYDQVQIESTKKDRSNDLHHAVDAAVIACVSPKLVKRLTEFYQKTEENTVLDINIDEHTWDKNRFPIPYKDFRNELIYRAYEKDKNVLLERLNSLSMYRNNQLEKKDVHVLYPVRLPNKHKEGPISAETIYGYNDNFNTITARKDVFEIKLKTKDELNYKLVDEKGGNRVVYETILKWLKEDKKNKTYPVHPVKGNTIKKVKVVISNNTQSKVKLGDKRFSENDKVIFTNFYRRKSDGLLCGVPIYYYQTIQEKKNKLVDYNIMWGQEDNKQDYISNIKLKEDYSLLLKLPRYSLIEIELKSGGHGICYSGGLTKGQFEVYSIIGDNIDLKEQNISNGKRAYITISTIKNIKLRNISLLGELS